MSNHQGQHLAPTSRLWPDSADGPWLLTFRWQVIGQRAECVGLDIAAALPQPVLAERIANEPEPLTLPEIGQPLLTVVLRDVKLAELLHEERIRNDHLAVKVPPPVKANGEGMIGMRPATVRRLELVASTYREAHAAGGKPVMAVAEKLKVSRGAASNLVQRAREAGLLEPA